MFKAARLQQIKNIITEKKQIDIATLSSLLSVTEVTIRNDLEKLRLEGFIIKTHGGALLNEKPAENIQDDTKEAKGIVYNKYKEHIGRIAAHMIAEGESIFLGAGTTCYYIAKALKDKKNINIVTTNLHVAAILSDNPLINIILTGGNLMHDINALTGEMVQKSLEGIFVNKAFISVSGVNINNGFTVSKLEELNVYRTVIKISKELIIVADYTKFNAISFVQLGPTSIANKIITNENIPAEYKAHFFEEGTQIFTSYDINYSQKGE